VIYVHPFEDNFDDNLVFLTSYWSKTMEREKGRERGKEHHVSMREKVVQKLSQNGCRNIISL